MFVICTQNKTFMDARYGCACRCAMNSTIPLPSLILTVITIKDARHTVINDGSANCFENNLIALVQVLCFCYTVEWSFPGARHMRHIPLTLHIKGMRNSKRNRDIISWQSLPGLSWKFHMKNCLGDHSLLWECEGMGTGEETVNNSSEESKQFSLDLSSARNSGSLTQFLKIQPSKMRILQVYQSDTG